MKQGMKLLFCALLASSTVSVTLMASDTASEVAATKKGTVESVRDLTSAEYKTGVAATAEKATSFLGSLSSAASMVSPSSSAASTVASASSKASSANSMAQGANGSSTQVVAQEIKIKLENGFEVVTKQPIRVSGSRKYRVKDKVLVSFDSSDNVVALALAKKR